MSDFEDLNIWYSDGPGNPVTAAQGIGYVQELVSRLTQEPITTYNSSTNSTLDGNNITFPLYQPIFADFSHDTEITTSKLISFPSSISGLNALTQSLWP